MPFDPNDADAKAAIKAAVDEALAKADTDTDGLKRKNAELIADLKEARKGKQIDPADMEKLEAKVEELTGKLTTADKTAKDATTAAEKATNALASEQGVTHRLIAENGLVAELTKVGVTDPAYLDAVKALHLGQVKVVADGEERKALYGDKPLADAIKEWAGSDIGKRFVSAPNNSGGGAQGGKGSEGGGKTMLRSQFDALDQTGRASFAKEGGKVVDQAA